MILAVLRWSWLFFLERTWSDGGSELMEIQLSAVKAKMGGVLLRGQASRTLGEVRPGSGVDIVLEFLPLIPGLHTVGGVRVSDYVSGESRDVELAEVFVVQHDHDEEGVLEEHANYPSHRLHSGTLNDDHEQDLSDD